ncbi:MAG: matrixin family metalloprotease [Actinomycetota bacterium]|nr:MAG: matrixin family metalloprotease [Actinomycetota bacterium]
MTSRRRNAVGTAVLAATAAALAVTGPLGQAPAPAAAAAAVGPSGTAAVGTAPVLRIGTAAGDATTYALTTVSVAGSPLAARWNPCQAQITVRANVAAAGRNAAARRSAVRDVKGALARLSAATGMRFVYQGRTSYVPRGPGWAGANPAEIVVAWVTPGGRRSSDLLSRSGAGGVAGTGGVAYSMWSGGPGSGAEIGRGYVVLNAAARQSFKPGFGAGVTRGDLLLHELGHAVGLQHVSSASEVMYPVIVPRKVAGYSAGDLAGLAAVGAAAGCIEAPTAVWPDL